MTTTGMGSVSLTPSIDIMCDPWWCDCKWFVTSFPSSLNLLHFQKICSVISSRSFEIVPLRIAVKIPLEGRRPRLSVFFSILRRLFFTFCFFLFSFKFSLSHVFKCSLSGKFLNYVIKRCFVCNIEHRTHAGRTGCVPQNWLGRVKWAGLCCEGDFDETSQRRAAELGWCLLFIPILQNLVLLRVE